MNSKRARRLLRVMAVSLGLATFLVVAQPAQAFTPASSRCPGPASFSKTAAYSDMWGNAVLQVTGPTVYRSSCSSGTQIVRVIYRLYRLNNNGTYVQDRAVWGDGGQNGRSLGPGGSYKFLNWNPSVMSNQAYGVTIFIEWWNTTGTQLGTYTAWYNQQGDFSCETRSGCHRWQHPTLGAGAMVCGPCYDPTYLIT
jgi:hypothetical protein